MKRSTRAGITSGVLLLSTLIPPYSEWRAPINFACVVLSCVLGALAASGGRKWWLLIPACVISGFVLDALVVLYAL